MQGKVFKTCRAWLVWWLLEALVKSHESMHYKCFRVCLPPDLMSPLPLAWQSRADLFFLLVAFKFALVHIAARIRNLLRDKDSFASQSILARKCLNKKSTRIAAFLSANPEFCPLFPRNRFPEQTLCSLMILITSGILAWNELFCNRSYCNFLIDIMAANPVLVTQ